MPPPFETAANVVIVRAPPACPFGHVPGSSLRPIGRSISNFDEHLAQKYSYSGMVSRDLPLTS